MSKNRVNIYIKNRKNDEKTFMTAVAAMLCGLALNSCSKNPISAAIDAGTQAIKDEVNNEKWHLENLQGWKVNNETSGAAITKFGGMDKCFTVEPMTDQLWNNYGIQKPANSTDLQHVRALFYRADKIVIGAVICHKDIATSVATALRKIYVQKYNITLMMPMSEELSRQLSGGNTFGYCKELSDGKAIVINGGKTLADGDKALLWMTSEGFSQQSKGNYSVFVKE